MILQGGGGGGITKRGSQQGNKKDSGQKKIVIQGLSIQEKVELHSAENAWKPTVKTTVENGGGSSTDQDPLEDLKKKARAILNKLTPQKFEKLVERFNELPIESEEALRQCMELIFEKVRATTA